MSPQAARRSILTARLRLVAADEGLAAALADFHQRNRVHLARWEPARSADFFRPETQRERLRAAAQAFAAGSGYAYWLQARSDDTGRVIGLVHFSSVTRGVFHSAMLGYAIDAAEQHRGLMREALLAGIDEMFSERVMLHRLQANVRLNNHRSRTLLARLGFRREGLARHYLFIDGQWRHHLMTALINPRFPATAAPPLP